MRNAVFYLRSVILVVILTGLWMTACSTPTSTPIPVATPEWDWFSMEMTDVQTGEAFTMNEFAGKVVLMETMAIWCPNCVIQANEVRKLHELLGDPEDFVSISLDVDFNEGADSLQQYAHDYGFEWRFAVAPLEVARSLGNLYSAEYLNPPLSPMLIIDRKGNVHHLEYGFKDVETLRKAVEPYLAE